MTARCLRDIVSKKTFTIETILLERSPDLVCRNMFCDKVTLPCLCRLEHALSFLDLSSVRYINLSKNKLSELPPSLAGMKNLEHLDISNNALRKLPGYLLSLSNLHTMKADGNDFNFPLPPDGNLSNTYMKNHQDAIFPK
jgi:hypothetical protein